MATPERQYALDRDVTTVVVRLYKPEMDKLNRILAYLLQDPDRQGSVTRSGAIRWAIHEAAMGLNERGEPTLDIESEVDT